MEGFKVQSPEATLSFPLYITAPIEILFLDKEWKHWNNQDMNFKLKKMNL
jgi:hypothetical protein